MIIQKNKVLNTPYKKPILLDVYYTETIHNKPVVVFCHGYKGFKDWGAWHLVAKQFAAAGFCFVKFNFSHNGGTLKEPIDFPDTEAFSNNNYSIELDDVKRVIDFLNVDQISLIGHSRGGGIALIKSEEDSRVNKVITWAGVSDYKKRFQEGSNEFKNWKKTGITFIENTRTKQQLPHLWQFYEDFIKNEYRLTIKRAATELKKPCLIIHGDEDQVVPIEEAQALHKWIVNSELSIVEGANHVFETTHPWVHDYLPDYLKTVVLNSIRFLKS